MGAKFTKGVWRGKKYFFRGGGGGEEGENRCSTLSSLRFVFIFI